MNGYENMVEIGKGSFATVFKATKKNGLFAIKRINIQQLGTKLLDNISIEIDILNKSRHRNVVSLVEVIKTDSEINIVMEFCDLGDLSFYIKKRDFEDYYGSRWGGLPYLVIKYFIGQLGI